MWPRQTEPGAQLGIFDRFQFFRQRVCSGVIGTQLVIQLQHFGIVGDLAVILGGNGGQLRNKFAAVLHDLPTVLGKLLIISIQQQRGIGRYFVAFQQRVFLRHKPCVAPQRHQIGPVHLAQRRIQKPPPAFRSAFDQTEQVRLKHNGLEVPGQGSRAALVHTVQFRGATRPLAAFTAHR